MSERDSGLSREAILALDKSCVWHPYTPMESWRLKAEPLVIERASGSRLYDMNGRSYIDGNSSWWTALLGHGHPRLVAALTEQASRLCHTALAGITHEPAVRFAEAFLKRAPAGMTEVFFSDNGSTAVEVAIKMAIQYQVQRGRPKKTRFLSLRDAFHGETVGVTALGGVSAFRHPFKDILMPVTHLPSPADGEEQALAALRLELERGSEQLAALVVEPLIQGAGGMRMYSPEYLRQARVLTEQYDVLLVLDEVFTGYGRTGAFWACEQAQIRPDILCSAKGLSGGMLPFSATLTTAEIFAAFLGGPERAFYYGHTYCGNPLGARIATEVLSVYEDEQVMAGLPQRISRLESAFAQLGELAGVLRPRVTGMCAALDLGEQADYLQPLGWKVAELCIQSGLMLRPLGNVVYVCPPLNIPMSDLEELIQILQSAVTQVVRS